jgi:hypothetical protein
VFSGVLCTHPVYYACRPSSMNNVPTGDCECFFFGGQTGTNKVAGVRTRCPSPYIRIGAGMGCFPCGINCGKKKHNPIVEGIYAMFHLNKGTNFRENPPESLGPGPFALSPSLSSNSTTKNSAADCGSDTHRRTKVTKRPTLAISPNL